MAGWRSSAWSGQARVRFFEVVGRPELAEQFPQPLYFEEERAALFPLLDDVFRARPTAEWCDLLAAAGLRFAPVRDHREVVADPSVWDNGYLVRAPAQDGSETPVVAAPVRFSATPAEVRADLPELGQHTEEVLLELGYTWDDIGELSAAGAI